MKPLSFLTRIRYNSLFFKIASVVLVSVLLASASIATVGVALSRKTFVDNFSRSNNKVLTQIAENYASLNDQIINVINRIGQSSEIESYLSKDDMTRKMEFSMAYRVQTYMQQIIPSNNFTDITTLVVGFNGQSYVDNADVTDLDLEALLNSELTISARNSPATVSYLFSKKNYTGNPSYSNSFVMAKALLSAKSREPYGVVYIFLRPDLMQGYYSHFTGNGNSVYLINSGGTVVSSSVAEKLGTDYTDLLDISRKVLSERYLYYNTSLGQQKIAVMTKYMAGYNCHLIGVIDKDAVLDELYKTSEIIFLALLIATATIVLAFFIIRQTTKPISMLVRKMPMITGGNFDHSIPVTGSYEVQQLAEAFNYMLDGLHHYMQEQMQMQNDKRKAEIHALQMQINPHFIYNTLSSIKFLMWQGNTEKSVQTIDAFILLLRNTISNRAEMISVTQEIDNLKNYVLINQVRYGEHIAVNFFTLPGCEQYQIPKLILQPFVENAFFHAFREKSEGRIRVFVKEQNGLLICEVMDNGIGMDGGQVHSAFQQRGQHFSGIGIENVDARIKLLYGEEYGVVISSEPHHGTTVRVRFPAMLLVEATPSSPPKSKDKEKE